jgi:kumamolisin
LLPTAPVHAAGETYSPQTVRLPGHVLPALAKATLLPPQPGDGKQPITLTIVLRRDDQAGFERYLHDLYDPHSKVYRHFLTQSEIADRFGPSQSDYNSVTAYFLSSGARLVSGSTNRLTITIARSLADIEEALDLKVRDYRIGERQFFANDRDPALPPSVGSKVQAIAGLSNLQKPHHTWLRAYIACASAQYSNPNCQFNPSFNFDACTAAVYANGAWNGGTYTAGKCTVTANATPSSTPVPTAKTRASIADAVAWSSVDGAGQTIGLVEFDTFNESDVTNFLSLSGLPTSLVNQLSEVPIGGGVGSPGPNEAEVLLDIDTTLSMAPGAKIVVYDAPFTGPGTSFQSIFNQMLSDKVSIISNSWSYCEDETTLSDVQSIDSIFQSAAASGASVFNGSGDSGSTCLDGTVNSIGVPTDSPNATAVGGSSESVGPSFTYGPEEWWNDADTTPPAGQGGFGVSKFFATPSYQAALNGSAQRSIPDVVVNADPFHGVVLCQADAGGCPTGQLYGGTSVAAPIWAAFAAQLNQAQGSNLGFFNPLIYPLAGSAGFHSAASLGSDFGHVGLGSPNVNALSLQLAGLTPGTPSASTSSMGLSILTPSNGVLPNGVYADGKTTAYVTVQLRDASGNTVAGKTIALSTGSDTDAQINPTTAVSSTDNGAATFQITDLTAENLTITGTDTTDGVSLSTQLSVNFIVPPAASASISAAPGTVANDGAAQSTISITLEDSLGRPAPGKQVTLQQTGGSVVGGPVPAITNSSGEIQFTAVDQIPETVTYTATDVTDGNLPVPGSAQVTFSGNASTGCGTGTPPALPGFLVTPYATGFLAQSVSYGGVNFGCWGAAGLAFDSAGDLYVSYMPSGAIYKFPPGGGVVSSSTLLTTTPLGPTLAGLAFDTNGNLYGGRSATTGNFTTGAIYQIDPTNGSIINTVASNLTCPGNIAVDPLTGDVFADDVCSGDGSDNPALWRISNPSTSPSTSVYTNLPGTPNATLTFAPSGLIYAWAFTGLDGAGIPTIAQITGTNGPSTPTVTLLPNLQVAELGLLAAGEQSNGKAETLFLDAYNGSLNQDIGVSGYDLTSTPPGISASIIKGAGAYAMAFGPDGCIYAAEPSAVFRISDTSGGCTYAAASQLPSIYLSPASVSPNPAQGSTQTFTATFHYGSVPDGTPVLLNVSGANSQALQANTTGGVASFSYTGAHQGVDTLTASATISGNPVTSNSSVVTWGAGTDVTFLTLNLSPTSGTTGQSVTLTANLTDVSLSPAAELSGQSIEFNLGGATCSGTTSSDGDASCSVTPAGTGVVTMSASFAGTTQYNPSSDSKGFNVLTVPPTPTPTPTPSPSPTPTSSPTPTPTPSPSPTPTSSPTPTPTSSPTPTSTPSPTPSATPSPSPSPTPSPTPSPSGKGQLLFLPPRLIFAVQAGQKISLPVFVTDISRFNVEFEDVTVSGPAFSIEKNHCWPSLASLHTCEVDVQFSPAEAGQFSGMLTFTDTAKGSPQTVPLYGQAKKGRK